MTMNQNGDVKLFQTEDDGDMSVVNGLVEMSGGLETSAYLSLFGGNEKDDGRADNPHTWWGNIEETEKDREYHSETQFLLKDLAVTTGNLRRVEDAARRDLAWFLAGDIVSSITVEASMPGLNRIQLDITIEAVGEETKFQFVENWKSTAVSIPEEPKSIGIDITPEIPYSLLLQSGDSVLLQSGDSILLQ